MRTGWVVLVLAVSAVGCVQGSGGSRWALRLPGASRSSTAQANAPEQLRPGQYPGGASVVASQPASRSNTAVAANAAPVTANAAPANARLGTAMGLFGPTPGALGLWPLPFPVPGTGAPANAPEAGATGNSPQLPGLLALPFDPRSLPMPQGLTLPMIPGLLPAMPASPAGPSSGVGGAAALEAEMLTEVNRRRSVGGVCPNSSHVFPPTAPLAIHDGLAKAAHFHSEDMASRGYFEHKSPDGEGPGPRGRRFGYNGIFTGENIEMGSRTAAAAVANWMSSTEGHCMNILDERYHVFGGGYAAGAPHWTANFGP